jgi:hypothetical protein
VCSTAAILIPPDYSPSEGTSEISCKYNEWLTNRTTSSSHTYDKLTLAEYMGGSGQCSSVLSDTYTSTAYFDASHTARQTYLQNNPYDMDFGSLESVCDEAEDDVSFLREAKASTTATIAVTQRPQHVPTL